MDDTIDEVISPDPTGLYSTPATAAASHVTDDDQDVVGAAAGPIDDLDHEGAATARVNKKRKQRRFHHLFPQVPTDEQLVCRFSCAYVTDKGALIQGHLYVSRTWINFYSNLLGFKKTITLPFSGVLAITKEKTAKFFPNAVGVRTVDNLYVFGSLISRDNTYHLLNTFFERSKGGWGGSESGGNGNGSAKPAEAAASSDDLPPELASIVPTIVNNTAKSTQVDDDESLFDSSSDEDFVDLSGLPPDDVPLSSPASNIRRSGRLQLRHSDRKANTPPAATAITSRQQQKQQQQQAQQQQQQPAAPIEFTLPLLIILVCTVCMFTLLMCTSLLTLWSNADCRQRLADCGLPADLLSSVSVPGAVETEQQLHTIMQLEQAIQHAMHALNHVRFDVQTLRDEVVNLTSSTGCQQQQQHGS